MVTRDDGGVSIVQYRGVVEYTGEGGAGGKGGSIYIDKTKTILVSHTDTAAGLSRDIVLGTLFYKRLSLNQKK